MNDFKSQKALRLTPETLAAQVLDGDNLHNLLSFVKTLRSNGLKIKLAAKNAWEIIVSKPASNYTNNQILRRLRINPDDKSWSVSLHYFTGYKDHVKDDETIKFVWDNLYNKVCHNKDCASIKDMYVFDKKFSSMCCNEQIRILNPSDKELKHAETLIMTAKHIVENKAPCKRLNL